MNKYDITLPDGKTISFFCKTLDEVLETANSLGYSQAITEKDITIDTKLLYMQYVNEIINNSEGMIYIRNKKHHLYKSNKGLIPIKLCEADGMFLDGCQYIEGRYDKDLKTIKPFEGHFGYPFGWTLSNPKKFLNIYGDNQLKFIHYSIRKYGQPKLDKPKELKGVKQAFSVDYIPNRCRCPIFILGNDVWIQHNDYFSESMKTPIEDIGTPLSYRCEKYLGKQKKEKFIYPDTWGEIVLRKSSMDLLKESNT